MSDYSSYILFSLIFFLLTLFVKSAFQDYQVAKSQKLSKVKLCFVEHNLVHGLYRQWKNTYGTLLDRSLQMHRTFCFNVQCIPAPDSEEMLHWIKCGEGRYKVCDCAYNLLLLSNAKHHMCTVALLNETWMCLQLTLVCAKEFGFTNGVAKDKMATTNIHFDEGLTLQTLALNSLHSGQFTLMVKPNGTFNFPLLCLGCFFNFKGDGEATHPGKLQKH